MKGERHVFVVDDDPSVRIGIARLLRVASYDVHVFSNANDFLASLKPGLFGCLILDVRMPGMSIEELIDKIHTMCKAIPIIVISADDDKEVRKMAQKINAVGFFRKPVDGTALLDAVRWALRVDKMNG